MSECCLIKKVATVEVYENKNEVRAYGFMTGDRNTPVMEVKFRHLWGEKNLSTCKLRWIIVDDVGSLLVGEVPISEDNKALIELPNQLFTGERRMKVQLTVASCDGARILNLQQFTDLKVINNLATNEIVEPVYNLLINTLYDETQKQLDLLEKSYTEKYGSLDSLYRTCKKGLEDTYAVSKASLEEYMITAENGGNADSVRGYIPSNFTRVESTMNELVNSASSKYKVGDIVDLQGYYVAGDGAHHKRKVESIDDGSGVQLVNGLWANIVHNGEVNVSWFGAKGDGVTDDTAFVKNAIGFSKKIIVDKTCRITSTLTIDGKTLVLSGEIVATVPSDIALLITGKNCHVCGGGKITSTSKTDGSIGVVVDRMYLSSIKDLTIEGFTQNYVTTETPISGQVSQSVVQNVKCTNGGNGFIINGGFSNEYVTYTSCISVQNDGIGVQMNAGNVNWVGGIISYNGTGVYMDHTHNGQHSTFTNVSINHNTQYQLHVKGVYYGHNFVGCNFHDNSIRWTGILLEDCRGINISNGNLGCDIEYRKTNGIFQTHQGFCSITDNFIVKKVDILNTGRENLLVNGNYGGEDGWHNDRAKQFVWSRQNVDRQIGDDTTNLKFDTNEDWRLSNVDGVISCKFSGNCKFYGQIKVIYNQLSEVQQDRITIHRKIKTDLGYVQLYESLPMVNGTNPAVFDINFSVPSGAGDSFVIRYEKLGGNTVEVFQTGSFYGFEIN